MSYRKIFMLSILCSGATFSWCDSFDDIEHAIRISDYYVVQKIVKEGSFQEADFRGFLDIAEEAISLRQRAIWDRKLRVYASIFLKCGVFPIAGYILDQRMLGVLLGIGSLFGGSLVAGAALAVSLEVRNPAVGMVGALVGLGLTAGAIAGCVKLEKWAWRKEFNSYDQLEREYQNALRIRSYLKRYVR